MWRCAPPPVISQYALPVASHVEMSLFSVQGRRVKQVVDAIEEPGFRSARVEAGQLAPGVYFPRMKASAVGDPNRRFTQARKIVLR